MQYHGHYPRLARLLHDRKFLNLITRVHVDEVHFIYTVGIGNKHGKPASRPAWGCLGELRIRLPKHVTFQGLSATLPKVILNTAMENLLMAPNKTLLIQNSVNRPSIIYITHVLINGASDLRNFDCIIPDALHPPMRLPKLILFHDKKTECNKVSTHLNNRLPPGLCSLDLCIPYHSDMSKLYLDVKYLDFADPDGTTLILCATSCASTVR